MQISAPREVTAVGPGASERRENEEDEDIESSAGIVTCMQTFLQNTINTSSDFGIYEKIDLAPNGTTRRGHHDAYGDN